MTFGRLPLSFSLFKLVAGMFFQGRLPLHSSYNSFPTNPVSRILIYKCPTHPRSKTVTLFFGAQLSLFLSSLFCSLRSLCLASMVSFTGFYTEGMIPRIF